MGSDGDAGRVTAGHDGESRYMTGEETADKDKVRRGIKLKLRQNAF